VTVFWVFDTV